MTDGTMDDRPLPTRRDRVDVQGFSALPPTYILPDEPSDTGSIGIGDFVRRRRWTILGALAVVVPLTALFTSTRPTVYQSQTTFLIETSDGGAEPPLEVLARAGQAGTMLTESELMISGRVVGPAVRQLGLNLRVLVDEESKPVSAVFPSFSVGDSIAPGSYRVESDAGSYTIRNEANGEIVSRSAGDSPLQFAGISLSPPFQASADEWIVTVQPLEGAIGSAKGRISAESLDKDSDIILLTCRGSSPDAAQDLCQAVTKSYMDLRREMQRSEATAAVAFLEEQIEQVAPRLKATEDSLRQYQEDNLAVALEARAAQAIQTQSSFQARSDELAAQRSALRSLIGNIESGEGGYATYPTLIPGNPVIGDLLASLVELENRRAELSKTRTDRNPDIIAIDGRIQAIEDQLRSIATTHDRALSAQIASLGGAAGQAAGRASTVPRRMIESGRLQRQVVLLDETYRHLQTKLRDARMAQSISLPSVQVVDPASTPTSPVSPNWPLNMGMSVVLGLAFGVALALWQERADTRVHERKELEEGTGIPVLAMLPSLRKPGPILPVSRMGTGGLAGPLVSVKSDVDRDIAREAFWSLMTDMRLAARRMENGGLRSVAVTSTTRGEGKTFSACNLALAQAGASMRTLLIDADLRGKGATRFFRLGSTTPGLSDVIFGSISPHDAWQPLTVDGRGELYVLAAGNANPENREPLNLERISELLNEAEGRFDIIVVDTPPLNVVSDAATVAASVDGVIVIVRGGLTDRSALNLTLTRLERANARVMGLVLNDVELPEYYTSYSHVAVDDEDLG